MSEPSASVGSRVHDILDIDLCIEMVAAGCLHLGESMEEVVDEEEVVEKVFGGEPVLFGMLGRLRHG